ncbi:MAG TPA: Na+/H+ antiporter subunit E [Clostridia bacterium]|nr:Na+/H+ antiporter subunit E [Clostridia bacterium]
MFPAYFLLWLVFNGRFTLEIVLIGLAVSFALALFSAKLSGHTLAYEMTGFLRFPRYLAYFGTLLIEIVKSAYVVIGMIVSNREVHPKLSYFRTGIQGDNLRVIYANSITLTPGTITVELQDGRYRVHALDASLLTGIADNWQVEMLKKLEGTQR